MNMKVIALEEAKANLEQYADECRTSPIVVTVGGKPAFEMLPIRSDDPDFLDRLLEQNAEFRRLMEERRREANDGKVSSLEEVRQRLALSDRKP
jgi:antitoxin (DNA-binding transcriptional repressor) of toxin-antitoxin stability system